MPYLPAREVEPESVSRLSRQEGSGPTHITAVLVMIFAQILEMLLQVRMKGVAVVAVGLGIGSIPDGNAAELRTAAVGGDEICSLAMRDVLARVRRRRRSRQGNIQFCILARCRLNPRCLVVEREAGRR